VAPEVAAAHGDSPVLIRLSTMGQPARVNISMPANPSFVPIVVDMAPNSTETINMTPFLNTIENRPAARVHQKGIFIQASAPVTAYYEVSSLVNPEIFPMKGNNALGTYFMVPGQNLFFNQEGNSGVDLVATEDGTQITVTLTRPAVGHPVGDFTIILNRGETYSVQASGTDANDRLIGTEIRSNKPIAVTLSDDSIRSGGFWDLIGDQLVPVELVGTEYVAVKGFADTEVVFVMATQNTTQVFVDGSASPLVTLNKGQVIGVDIRQGATYIRTSRPAYAYQLTGHRGEFGDALLPQIECTGSGQVGFVRPNTNAFAMVLLTRAGNENSFTLNGVPMEFDGPFQQVPGNSEWRYRIEDMTPAELPPGPSLLQNEEGFFHLGILHELGASSVYGYFSNYNTYSGSNQLICPGGETVLDPGPYFDSYLWSDGSTGQTLQVTEPGTYTLRVEFENCFAIDTFNVSFAPTSVDLGEDTGFCEGQSAQLNAGGGFDLYEWRRDGENTPFAFSPGITVRDSGSYNVTVANICGTYTDTIIIDVTDRPTVDIGFDQVVCDQQQFTLDAGDGFDTYRWDDGSMGQTREVNASGTYGVTVTKGFCTLTDEITLRFVDSPRQLSLGEDRMICVNEEIVLRPEGDTVNRYEWSDGSTADSLLAVGEGTYWVIGRNECGETRAEITFRAVTDSDLFFPNVFTPNGDRYNQHFVLTDWLLGSELTITNRWGDVVYESEAYQNDWEGEGLPAGTYYYYIKSECLDQVYKGWLRLM